MDINTDSMTKVSDVNKTSYSPDLKYSDQTERWTMNERVQDILELDDSHGLNMYVAEDNESGEQVVLLEIVDAQDAEFFKGEGNVFVARRLADAIDHHSFALIPAEDQVGQDNMYILSEWEGDSEIVEEQFSVGQSQEEVTEEEVTIDEEDKDDDLKFDYGGEDSTFA